MHNLTLGWGGGQVILDSQYSPTWPNNQTDMTMQIVRNPQTMTSSDVQDVAYVFLQDIIIYDCIGRMDTHQGTVLWQIVGDSMGDDIDITDITTDELGTAYAWFLVLVSKIMAFKLELTPDNMAYIQKVCTFIAFHLHQEVRYRSILPTVVHHLRMIVQKSKQDLSKGEFNLITQQYCDIHSMIKVPTKGNGDCFFYSVIVNICALDIFIDLKINLEIMARDLCNPRGESRFLKSAYDVLDDKRRKKFSRILDKLTSDDMQKNPTNLVKLPSPPTKNTHVTRVTFFFGMYRH